jgi:outer membrane lipopolysaccharide assembly protein LptE/RlpB
MIKKKILYISLIFFLTNCGFSPVYLKNTNLNFSIEQVNFTGDRDLNNFLRTNLNQYKNKNVKNKLYIDASSIYKKIILSKDGTGQVTNYQLEAEVIFLVKPLNKKIKITEEKVMDSMNDKFDEDRYERIIKQNFASSISNKLSLELIID